MRELLHDSQRTQQDKKGTRKTRSKKQEKSRIVKKTLLSNSLS